MALRIVFSTLFPLLAAVIVGFSLSGVSPWAAAGFVTFCLGRAVRSFLWHRRRNPSDGSSDPLSERERRLLGVFYVVTFCLFSASSIVDDEVWFGFVGILLTGQDALVCFVFLRPKPSGDSCGDNRQE